MLDNALYHGLNCINQSEFRISHFLHGPKARAEHQQVRTIAATRPALRITKAHVKLRVEMVITIACTHSESRRDNMHTSRVTQYNGAQSSLSRHCGSRAMISIITIPEKHASLM